MTDEAAHRKALRVFGKRAFSMRDGGRRIDYPPARFSVGTSYVRDGAIHLVIKGNGSTWERAFKAAAVKR